MGLPLTTVPMIGSSSDDEVSTTSAVGHLTAAPRRRNEVGKEAPLERPRPERRWSADLASAALLYGLDRLIDLARGLHDPRRWPL